MQLTMYLWLCYQNCFLFLVRHERQMIWTQSAGQVWKMTSISGDPREWVLNQTAVTRYISPAHNHGTFTSLAFDFQRQTLYWSDTLSRKIVGLDRVNSEWTVFSGTSGQVRGLAVDWIANNIYWTDGLYNWIMVASLQQPSRNRILISTGLDKPAGLVVYPFMG